MCALFIIGKRISFDSERSSYGADVFTVPIQCYHFYFDVTFSYSNAFVDSGKCWCALILNTYGWIAEESELRLILTLWRALGWERNRFLCNMQNWQKKEGEEGRKERKSLVFVVQITRRWSRRFLKPRHWNDTVWGKEANDVKHSWHSHPRRTHSRCRANYAINIRAIFRHTRRPLFFCDAELFSEVETGK